MSINEDITLSNIWWNGGLRGYFFRSQAEETLEELVDAVNGRNSKAAFDELEERIEDTYSYLDDFEEDCYRESVETLLENLGY